ncbi:energy transducer TonB [Christiangramia sp. SM2212]|uniref:Energy transducer TonB n=1 Tax=Christiangramia sediminicola TaxID=3073267 RepID=A0ABU1EM69_9FLAO|nr:energy transducer TonB [Christiangramia sp. SM2212]MDR5589474.1 energy transducer TonB [Christiangramia sp. SM2212]
MKKLFIIALMFTGLSTFAQDDVSVKGNSVTMKETAPVWTGCEDSSDTKACFNKMLMQHIKENIKYSKNSKGEWIRGKAIVKMEVNEEGNVVVNSVDSKYPELKKEAKRLMESIPTMTPGKLGGKAKAIKYTIPLTF